LNANYTIVHIRLVRENIVLSLLNLNLTSDRGRPRIPSASTGCIQLPRVVEDVNGTATGRSFDCVPLAVKLEQFAINSARQQFVSESVQRAELNDVYLRSWTITNTIRRCRGVLYYGAVYKCPDLLTYLNLRLQNGTNADNVRFG